MNQDGPPVIDFSAISFSESDTLGAGAFGKVYRGTVHGMPCAIKIPINQRLSPRDRDLLVREVNVLRKVFHPNIVQFLGASVKEGEIAITLELMVSDLETYLRSERHRLRGDDGSAIGKGLLGARRRLQMVQDAAYGLQWIHKALDPPLCHRELRAFGGFVLVFLFLLFAEC
jgi:serine/threonine protein kinase